MPIDKKKPSEEKKVEQAPDLDDEDDAILDEIWDKEAGKTPDKNQDAADSEVEKE